MASNAKWVASNPQYYAAYRAANSDKVRDNQAAWYAANSDNEATRAAAYRAAHIEKYRIYSQNRRARKRESGGKLSPGLSAKLFKLQKGKCACGCKQQLGNNYHLDHIMPLALGGTNTDDNMQLLRQRCNNQKHTKHPIDFMQQRGFLI
jgi:5-methylcytosine-specific restriction endonuclease McrA